MKNANGPARSGARCSLFAALILAAAALLGCAGEAPKIARIVAVRVFTHDIRENSYTQGLSVFLVASDEDGMEDLSTLYVINDAAELFWSVDSKSWSSSAPNGETWIGTNGFVMPDGGRFPNGTYRVVLQDAGGDTAEEKFTLSGRNASPSPASYPSATQKNGEIRVKSVFAKPEIWLYAKDDRFLTRLAAGEGAPPLTLKAVAAAYPSLGEEFTYWVYATDTKNECGLLAGPYASGSLAGK
jgi:hypothetical protein